MHVESFCGHVSTSEFQANQWRDFAETSVRRTDLVTLLEETGEIGLQFFYVYRQSKGNHVQTGLLATVNVRDYLTGRIKPHEQTRQEKPERLQRGLSVSNIDVAPVFLIHRPLSQVKAVLRLVTLTREPSVNFVGSDGYLHQVWQVPDGTEEALLIVHEMEHVSHAVVADGHHRLEATAKLLRATAEKKYERVTAFLVSADEVVIDNYHRIVTGVTDGNALANRLALNFEVIGRHRGPLNLREREFALFSIKEWTHYGPRSPRHTIGGSTFNPIEWQRDLFVSYLGINDPTVDGRLVFVPGDRRADDVVALVHQHQDAIGIVCAPPSSNSVLEAAEEGIFFPPHATWFRAKPLAGLVVRMKEALSSFAAVAAI
jgi:uncharacterized protein (DUF1015 family)